MKENTNKEEIKDTPSAFEDERAAAPDLLRCFPRMERDGKVAVLYSPGFGAGWATWNNDEWIPLLTTHRDIVQAVLDGSNKGVGELAERLIREAVGKTDAYVCVLGAENLKVIWLTKGSQFEIEEYDGAESVHVIGHRRYQTV